MAQHPFWWEKEGNIILYLSRIWPDSLKLISAGDGVCSQYHLDPFSDFGAQQNSAELHLMTFPQRGHSLSRFQSSTSYITIATSKDNYKAWNS